MAIHEYEVWVLSDADGDYEVGTSKDVACERYAENISDAQAPGSRLIKIVVQVEIPDVVPIVVNVPAKEGAVTLTVE